MWKDFTNYIINNYNNDSKVVEVAIGNFSEIASNLKIHSKLNIIMTDIKPSHECIIQDDICQPNIELYEGASLIYSIRTPEELHPYLIRVAESVGADLIIRPLYTDSTNFTKKLKLINYNKAFFYILRFNK